MSTLMAEAFTISQLPAPLRKAREAAWQLREAAWQLREAAWQLRESLFQVL
jgi:thymidylate synthase ThyX